MPYADDGLAHKVEQTVAINPMTVWATVNGPLARAVRPTVDDARTGRGAARSRT